MSASATLSMSLNEVGDNDDDDIERRQTENSGYGRRLVDQRGGCCCHDDETSVSRLIDLVVNHRRPLTSEATSTWTPTMTAT